ncbi:DUF6542 domain-containing protein [Streptomyces abyssomicinicus]|uniref:DUF6542 domain-containing protein n=1 Tax=Streptomyces abyssomicinicus TaxID=574929 RepID=UPI001FE3ECB8|nr:DUF6542 domain-containing protein [Streptomyces abyssomicinicus]
MTGLAAWSARAAESARGSRVPLIAATAARGSAAARAIRRFPNPRLTGLGCGLFCAAAMVTLGLLSMLLGGSLTVYGLLFLPVSLLTAVWVRPGDLLTAPIIGPIAYALGLLFIADGSGVGGQAMGYFTALATGAGWLYGGVLITGLTATGRWLHHTSTPSHREG